MAKKKDPYVLNKKTGHWELTPETEAELDIIFDRIEKRQKYEKAHPESCTYDDDDMPETVKGATTVVFIPKIKPDLKRSASANRITRKGRKES